MDSENQAKIEIIKEAIVPLIEKKIQKAKRLKKNLHIKIEFDYYAEGKKSKDEKQKTK